MTNTNFIDYLRNTASDHALLNAWAEYLDATNNPDDTIFEMDSFDELMYGKSPSEIVDSTEDNFNTGHDYFQLNGYGLAVSSDFIGRFIDFKSLANYLEENECDLYEEFKDYCEE